MSARAGLGYDSHRLAEGRRLVLGGVEIDDARHGPEGHSDADVLTHAVIDALLGAAGLGDIGQHFPDTEERYRDADSAMLLSEVCTFLEDHGWTIRHVDATVMCEEPKLDPHRDAMRSALAGTIGLRPLEVNVKFTTGEGMGFVGRGEGIAAQAVATVERADAGESS
jgi:2-C-methyl-D-erythritol 2,4-cyclodiphosphate synthase